MQAPRYLRYERMTATSKWMVLRAWMTKNINAGTTRKDGTLRQRERRCMDAL